jgi:hypothetical protein
MKPACAGSRHGMYCRGEPLHSWKRRAACRMLRGKWEGGFRVLGRRGRISDAWRPPNFRKRREEPWPRALPCGWWACPARARATWPARSPRPWPSGATTPSTSRWTSAARSTSRSRSTPPRSARPPTSCSRKKPPPWCARAAPWSWTAPPTGPPSATTPAPSSPDSAKSTSNARLRRPWPAKPTAPRAWSWPTSTPRPWSARRPANTSRPGPSHRRGRALRGKPHAECIINNEEIPKQETRARALGFLQVWLADQGLTPPAG